MSVLITGGLGYIGSHTVSVLLEKGIECIIIDNLSNSSIETKQAIEDMTNKKFKFVKTDLLEYENLQKVFQENNIESVIHFAGLKSVSESVSNPLKYYEENLLSTIYLLKAMKKYEVYNMVFSSSATVYGNSKPPVREGDKLISLNPYGETKLIIENILRDLANSDSRYSIVSLRYFNPIGADPRGFIGEKLDDKPGNLMPIICQVANGTRKVLEIYGDDYATVDGSGVRDYIHVLDLAEGHYKALRYLNNNHGFEEFNLGTGKGYSVFELINNFETVNNVKIPSVVTKRREGDIPSSYACVEKARKHLNWESKRDIKEMCRDAWNWANRC